MHDTLSCRELAQTLVGGSLGRVLAKLGAQLDRQFDRREAQKTERGDIVTDCESQNQPQPLLNSIYPRENGLGLAGRHVRPDGLPC